VVPQASSLDPVLPADSEYCVNPLAHQVFSVAQTDLQAFSVQNGLNGQVGTPLLSATCDGEILKPALLAGQPLVYVPSTSLFMLYGNLQEGPTPGLGSERAGKSSEVLARAELLLAPTLVPPTQKRLCEERQAQEEDEPASKRHSQEFEDSPLSLVMPKVGECGWMSLVTCYLLLFVF
jgi:transcription factor E2F7/8